MDWRKRKQLSIFMTVVIILGLFAWYFYTINKETPTCFDNKKNGVEEGVDCGGSCIPCKLLQVQDAQTIWSKVLQARPGSFDVLAQIKNPNIYFGTMNLTYEFELLDEKGASIGIRQGSTFLLPEERVTLVEPDIRTNLKARDVIFKIISADWGRVYEPVPKYDLGLGKRDYRVLENPQGIKQSIVTTSVYNRSGESFSRVFVSIFLYDTDKNIIATNRTEVENLSAGESRPITFVWPQEITQPIDGIEGEVRVNSFIR